MIRSATIVSPSSSVTAHPSPCGSTAAGMRPIIMRMPLPAKARSIMPPARGLKYSRSARLRTMHRHGNPGFRHVLRRHACRTVRHPARSPISHQPMASRRRDRVVHRVQHVQLDIGQARHRWHARAFRRSPAAASRRSRSAAAVRTDFSAGCDAAPPRHCAAATRCSGEIRRVAQHDVVWLRPAGDDVWQDRRRIRHALIARQHGDAAVLVLQADRRHRFQRRVAAADDQVFAVWHDGRLNRSR